jgi:hypothetical protein
MHYQFRIDTHEAERIEVLGAWSMFSDEHLSFRPHPDDRRGRSVHEQMVHQFVSEDFWFRTMLGIEIGAPPLPKTKSRLELISKYANDSLKRLESLQLRPGLWWCAGDRSFLRRFAKPRLDHRPPDRPHCPSPRTAASDVANVEL